MVLSPRFFVAQDKKVNTGDSEPPLHRNGILLLHSLRWWFQKLWGYRHWLLCQAPRKKSGRGFLDSFQANDEDGLRSRTCPGYIYCTSSLIMIPFAYWPSYLYILFLISRWRLSRTRLAIQKKSIVVHETHGKDNVSIWLVLSFTLCFQGAPNVHGLWQKLLYLIV